MSFGIVYLLHLNEPLKHAQHYIGWTSQPVPARLSQHRRGQGAHFLKVAAEQGLKFELVAVWMGTRRFERRLKNRKNARRFCPLCQPVGKCQRPINNEVNIYEKCEQ